MDQYKFSDPEEMVSCPYNEAHLVTRKRLQIHLDKCRKQHPESAKLFKTCAFNITHKIPKPEMLFHEEICPDRETLYTHTHQVGNTTNSAVSELLKNTEIELYVPSTEDWGDDSNPYRENILDVLERNAVNRGVLRSHMNEPPAVRKARREEDRRRFRAQINEEENAKMNPVLKYSSSVATTSNEQPCREATYSSAVSAISDSSYNTALNTTTERLQGFQLVSGKKKRGRGAGKPSASVEQVSAGLGRGQRLANMKR